MPVKHIKTAMVLAAGLGKRIRDVDSKHPKPMINVAGRSLIYRVLDHLCHAGIEKVVVNVHYKADQLEQHLVTYDKNLSITLSDERGMLLETGGGVKKALPLLGDTPFFVVNSDALWSDPEQGVIETMDQIWNPDEMNGLLALVPTDQLTSYQGKGDFYRHSSGLIERQQGDKKAPYLFSGIQILTPELFTQPLPEHFSLNKIYDRALDQKKLFGIPHPGVWHHVGSPKEFEVAEAYYSDTAYPGNVGKTV